MKRFGRLLMITMTALAGTVTAQAQSLRSDSPLWTDETPHTELFPRAFWDDYSFGCQSSLRMGVWQFTPADEPDYPFALEASRRPPAGRLTFIAPAEEMPPNESDAPEPDPGQSS